MKINILDAHDRLLFFKKQADHISQGCQDCIKNRPQEFGLVPFYIYAHARTADDGFTKRLVWMPRLSKPKAQTNSMLFKYYPETDLIKIIWMIPARELWRQYKKENLTEDEITSSSIHKYLYNREELEAKEPDDLTDELIKNVYLQISFNASNKKLMERIYADNGASGREVGEANQSRFLRSESDENLG